MSDGEVFFEELCSVGVLVETSVFDFVNGFEEIMY